MTFEPRRLGDVAEIVGGGTPSTKEVANWDGDVPWLTPKDLASFEGVYVEKGSRSISEVGLRRSSAKMLPKGSVLYTSRAPIGYVAIASRPIATYQGFKSLVLKDGYVPEFVFYLLKASKPEIESHASGGTFAEISAGALANVILQFPPEKQQKAIAGILLSIDAKIAANRAQSRTLEEIAQAIFKSWFIDFDPVKAKMVGEAPVGMDAETAALFPDSMEESELGEIPTGWQIQHFDYWAQIISGGTPKTSTDSYWNGNIPWFSVADAPSQGGVFFVKTAKRISEDGLEHSAANLVRPGVAILSARGTVGKVAMVAKSSTFNQSCFGIEGKWGDGFNYLMVKSQVAKLQGLAHGGMFDTITRETFKSLVFPFAGVKIVEAFNNVADPIFDLIRNLQFENETLGTLRDSLLPRLISGELEIPDELLAA